MERESPKVSRPMELCVFDFFGVASLIGCHLFLRLGLNEKAISNVLAGKETKGKVTTTDSKEKGLLKSPVNPRSSLFFLVFPLHEAWY